MARTFVKSQAPNVSSSAAQKPLPRLDMGFPKPTPLPANGSLPVRIALNFEADRKKRDEEQKKQSQGQRVEKPVTGQRPLPRTRMDFSKSE